MTNSRQNKRDVNGVLLLDKPAGMTSNQCLQRVKYLFHARKAGHTGSLDKPATGLLPICFGQATKFSGFLLNADKEYQALCQLGVRTTTGDADGEIIETKPVPALAQKDLIEVIAGFRGEIKQVPPMFSALKQNGQRLYKLAYQGIDVDRKPRIVQIYQLELINFDRDLFEIRVFCSKGTYIRSLVGGIGNIIGCGAHIRQLRRLRSGPFSGENMVSMERLETIAGEGEVTLDRILLPVDSLLAGIPDVHLSEALSYYISQGNPVVVPGIPSDGLVRIYNEQDNLLGLAVVQDDGRLAPKRLISHPEISH